MGEISLRAYIRDIDSMIDRGDLEEAIIHCRYILTEYPKHIHTYRLLGKSFLEGQRYGDAADVFQRVLSSVPDDYISHIGMSLIREDEANIEAAIYHMERAAEVQPANQAIQAEQRRLYGRRDRVEPSRVGLTRGALARMYYNGELYSQAITELRTALAEEPQRSDLRLLLANTYYKSGREVDAADACSSILSKLPYCLEANLMLAEILSTSKRSEESKIYFQRVYELDPYAEYINRNNPSPTAVPDNSVMIERLDDESEQDQELTQADWITSIGLQNEDLKQKPSPLPEWLLEEPSDQLSKSGELESNQDHIPPFTFPEDDEEIEPTITEPLADYADAAVKIGETDTMIDQNIDKDDLLPDWLKDAGWQPAVDGEGAQEIEDTIKAETSTLPEISEADIPDWLQALAPPEDVAPGQKTETQPTTGELGEAAARSWLDETPSVSTEGGIDWLGLQTQAESDTDISLSGGEIEAPEWLKNLTPSSEISKEEIPDWLEDLEEAISDEEAETDDDTISEKSEMSEPEDSPVAEELGDASPAESIIDDVLKVTAVGITAAEQSSQSEPEDGRDGSLISGQDPTDTMPEGDDQAEADGAQDYPALEISEQPEEGISEQPMAGQETVGEVPLIVHGEIPPLHEDKADIEPIETESGPFESIPDDVPTKELLDQSSDDLLQTTPEGSKGDAGETVDSFPDSSIESMGIHQDMDELEKTETRDTEPYTWLDESAFQAPDSDGSLGETEETDDIETSQPELRRAAEAEVAMNENNITDKVDDAAESERVNIPDWLDDFDSVPIREAPVENEPGEIPDWLHSLAPQEAESADVGGGEQIEEPNAIESLTMGSIDTESDDLPESISSEDLLPDWLSAESPAYSPAQIASEPILDWLESMGDEETSTSLNDVSTKAAADSWTPTIDIEEPPILADDTQPSILSAHEESDSDKLEPEIASSGSDIEVDISDQVEEFPITADLDIDDEADVIPDWLSEIASVSPMDEEVQAEESGSDIPDWLLGLAEDAEAASDLKPTEAVEADFESKQEAGTEDAIPDWVQELAPSEPGVIEDAEQFFEPTAELETPIESTLSQVGESDIPSAEIDDMKEEFQSIDDEDIEQSIEEEQQEPETIIDVQTEEHATIEDAEAYDSEQSLPYTEADTEELSELIEEEELEIQASPGLMVIETATLNATITAIEHADESLDDASVDDFSSESDAVSMPTSEADIVQKDVTDHEVLADMEIPSSEIGKPEPDLPEWLTGIEESPDIADEADWQPSKASEISETDSPADRRQEQITEEISDIEDEYQIALAQARNALVQGDQDSAISQYSSLIQSKQYLPEVINDLQGALTQSPTDMTLWQTLGDAYANADRLQDALDAYTKTEQLLG